MGATAQSRAAYLASAFPPSPSGLASEVQAAIEGAEIIVREATEDGQRVYIASPSFRGSFLFDTDEAERRISKAFPGLGGDALARAIRHLQNRVMAQLQPAVDARRRQNSYVHGWRN